VVAAFGCLDEGEGDAGAADFVPVDVALPFRHVDAVDGIEVGMALAEIDRLVVAIAAVAGRIQLLHIGLGRLRRLLL
jgi:hypothetical protein